MDATNKIQDIVINSDRDQS